MHLRDFLSRPWEVYVLAPALETDDETLQYYYDFTQSIAEFTKAFAELGIKWHWLSVTLANFAETLDQIKKGPHAERAIIFNLCDGDEINDVPGLSVVRHLARGDFVFSGAREPYYCATTSKITMKEAFDRHNIATPEWRVASSNTSAHALFEGMQLPLIVKPSVSAGSMGISLDSVVHTSEALERQLDVLNKGCHGWNTAEGGIYLERFIMGREFTTLIVGNAKRPKEAIVYAPAERVFDRSLPVQEQFLSFDRLWEFYEKESPLPLQAPLYMYEPVEPELAERIKALSFDAYAAVSGSGYGRVDLRLDAESQQLFVLEVNAQCGLSEDENFTSVGAILRFEQKAFSDLLFHILVDAVKEAGDTKRNIHNDENLCASA